MSAPTLFVLAADLTKMQVLASLDESDVGRIRPGQLVSIPRGRVSDRRVLGRRHAGAPAAHDSAERRDVSDGHRRAEPGLEAEAGDDGEREHRDRAAQQMCFACRTRPCVSARLPKFSRRWDRRPRLEDPAAAVDVAPAQAPIHETLSPSLTGGTPGRRGSAGTSAAASAAGGASRTAARSTAVAACRTGPRGFSPTGQRRWRRWRTEGPR